MPIESIPDWEKRLARQDAFWDRAVIDRPVVCITFPRADTAHPAPKPKSFANHRERWLDAEYVAETALAQAMRTEYMGDALPHVFPNLGPEVFSAYFGCELEYGEDTAWSIPSLPDWAAVDRIKFSEDNLYYRKTLELTDALLAAGRNRFYTGITDLHPGGDAIAAFRDPLRLNIDLIEAAAEVKQLLRYVTDTYLRIYDAFHAKLRAEGQAIANWSGIVSTRRWYVPSNDFSCMISQDMFDEIFLPGIVEECRHLEASIYHLDGPGALRHLDSLLEIRELNAIQWVYGAGNGRASDWLHVYRKCQAAGKGLQIDLYPDEIELFRENLRPEGLWLNVRGIKDEDEARAVIDRIARWR